ncbi:MAG TPA: polysaccharide deacetylase family protein [Chitinophagaceae bacterium]
MKSTWGSSAIRFERKARTLNTFFIAAIIMLFGKVTLAQQTSIASFTWPEGKQAALSLSFDDARLSQVDSGTALLDQFGIKATFFVVPSAVEERINGWKQAVANGHEIGNHTFTHPCTGNFSWSRKNALENYNLDSMRNEMMKCNNLIQQLLNVKPEVFAYPCGQKFIGRGINTKSYVPLVSELFISGRGWRDEAMNDPAFCDLAQISGIEMDGKNFDEILPLIEEAKKTGQWLVLAGHEMGTSGVQTTRLAMLKQLLEYVQNPANRIWIAPVGDVAKYIRNHGNIPQK